MNRKVAFFISNFSYTLTANIVTFLVSAVTIAIVPKVLGVEEYGYFQLYLFYTSYVIFFHLGIPNGIYLRYGGKEYKELNKNLFTSQFWMMTAYVFIVTVIGSMTAYFFLGSEKKVLILLLTNLCALIIIPRDFILLMFQATYRIKDYVKATIIDRIVYVSFTVILLAIGSRAYVSLVLADLLGKGIALTWLLFQCRDMVFVKISHWKQGLGEIIKNITSGGKILLSNIADMMIIGIIRMGIEYKWNIETFGKVSLTLSLSNLMMVIINAVSVVIYPMLRRTTKEELPKLYSILRNILMIPLLGMMIIYYPVKQILGVWLPNYADSLIYIALLFPICVYESKMSMLVNTYLKSLRKEAWILIVNLIAVLLSFLCSFVTLYFLNSLTLTLVSIVFVLAFRCIFAEILLSKKINIKINKDIILELIMCIVFMITGWLIHSYISMLLYAACYLVYLFIKKKDIIEAIHEVKSIA